MRNRDMNNKTRIFDARFPLFIVITINIIKCYRFPNPVPNALLNASLVANRPAKNSNFLLSF